MTKPVQYPVLNGFVFAFSFCAILLSRTNVAPSEGATTELYHQVTASSAVSRNEGRPRDGDRPYRCAAVACRIEFKTNRK
jgi:hypothetical protein